MSKMQLERDLTKGRIGYASLHGKRTIELRVIERVKGLGTEFKSSMECVPAVLEKLSL
jgi:hypothetical protein